MKRLIFLVTLIVFSTSAFSQDQPEAKQEDVNSLDNIIAALYDVISGPKGEKRDWDRMRSLFMKDAKLIPTGKKPDGSIGHQNWTVDQYIETAGASLEANGFFEVETHRITEDYGTITHVFSTYDSRRKLEDEKPFARGINSIQLMKDDHRWEIMTIMVIGETEAYPLPKKYLGN